MKLNQLIALTNGKKSRAVSMNAEILGKLSKPDLLQGISRNYRAKDDDGEALPPESKKIQVRVWEALERLSNVLSDVYDSVATQDKSNTIALADLVVDGTTIATGVPVTTLLFLEKQLVDIHNLVKALPTLDPTDDWSFDENTDAFSTPAVETARSKKVPAVFVLYPATKEHPAQVQTYNEDILVGYWATKKFSGAMPLKEKTDMLQRVEKLQDAIKLAREKANNVDVVPLTVGERMFGYLFDKSAS